MEQQPTSGSSIPSDLISDILLRLPAKSVGRFRCVSKLWLSITTDPCFIKTFGTTRPSLLLCSMKGQNLFVTSTPQHFHQSSIRSYSSSQPIHRYPMKLPGEQSYFSCMHSVHGLICMEDLKSRKPFVWNPSMEKLLQLPKPKMSSRNINVFFGYDSVEGKHKVLCLPYREICYVGRVFTLGSEQESWRTVRTNLKHMCCGYAYGRCIKGAIYYLAYIQPENSMVVMSFDVRSEIFHMIELPLGIDYIDYDVLISYDGRLACIGGDDDTRLWILEDADKHNWSFQDFLLPLIEWELNVCWNQDVSFEYKCDRFELKGCTHAGEFIYVPSIVHESSYIIFYDPVRNSCRRLKFEGIVDGEFGNTMHVFPDHIESLMSF
ncbi:putative F-box protein [Raphanus sativus]|uniref:F-box protein At3g10240 n=1 Tax=Raphanus sativus TaxID=3726 RepID=A0A6J0MY43_RAPSA|nr:putative F-box protein At3g10240 [Raphanus sativus]KAJ4917423.1 putative F-box protein [Raphanus sativus]